MNFLDASLSYSNTVCTHTVGIADGTWNKTEDITCILELCALPITVALFPYYEFYDLLPYVNGQQKLDVFVQDDTGVDYIELCQPQAGACCKNLTCQQSRPACCNGLSIGPGTNCTAPEACCLANNATCQMLDPLCCIAFGGTPHGPGSQCQGDNDYNGIDDTCECVDPPPDMVAWYTGDDSSASDFLGNHDGVIVNENNLCLGHVGGGSLAFSSTNGPQYVEVPHNCELDPGDGDFTVDLWVYPTSDGPLLIKGLTPGPGYSLELVNGKVLFSVDNGINSLSTLSVPSVLGGWHYVAATFRRVGISATVKVYVDNFPAVSVTDPFFGIAAISSSCPLRIGARPSCAAPFQFLDGCMDEVEIFTRALGLSEIRAIFHAYTAGKCKDGCFPSPPSNCPNGDSGEMTAGTPDDFSPVFPTDPLPTPDLSIPACIAPTALFDDTQPNQRFCHTFSGLPTDIGAATLQIRLRNLGGSSCNDTLALQWNGFANNFLWIRHIGTGPLSCPALNLGPGLVPCPWDTFDDRHTFCLDLAKLPLPSGATFNLLPFIQGGQLDVSVQDNTAVDYIRLLYDFNCSPKCQPKANGLACLGTCASGLSCQPNEVTCYSSGGCVITSCGCLGGNRCHAQLGGPPFCDGTCPLNSLGPCTRTPILNPNGSTTHGCRCTSLDFPCATDCDDGLVCNGCETSNSEGTACEPGTNPCPPGFDCDEDQDTCVELTGACCDTLNGVCSEGILAADCVGDHRVWTKNATCAEVACDPAPGACCDRDVLGACTETTVMACDCKKCVWHKLLTCAQIECTHTVIPTVSQWGLVVLTLLLLIGAKIYFYRYRTALP